MRALWCLLLPLLIAALITTCEGPGNGTSESPSGNATGDVQLQYANLRARVLEAQQTFTLNYPAADDATGRAEQRAVAKEYLLHVLADSVFSCWYETKWDYSGTTETPGEGSIACGYFVSTTLKHCGFELDRYTLAQQPASNIIRTLCDPATLKRIGHNNIAALEQHLQAEANGLYILGLDNHVGFVLKNDEGLWMIHSTSSVTPARVVKEKLTASRIVLKSQNYYVANLLDHAQLLDQWILNQTISVVST